MPLDASSFALLDDLTSRLAAESIFAHAGSDEGLVPVYSLLGDFLGHLVDEPELAAPLTGLRSRLDSLLDSGKAWDEAAEQQLRATVEWLPGALAASRHGRPVAAPAQPAVACTASPAGALAPEQASADLSAGEDSEELIVVDLEENGELLAEFQVEAAEHLQQIEAALLTLDTAPEDRDALNALFRSFHTLKGVSGFMHLRPMHRLSHEVESLLDLARTGRLRLGPAIITDILRSRDALQQMTTQISHAIAQGRQPDSIVPVAGLVRAFRAHAACRGEVAAAASSAIPVQAPGEASVPVAAAPSSAPSERGAVAQAASVRVNTAKLDSLVDTVGELVIAQSQLQEAARGADAHGNALSRVLSQFGRITKELQLTAMSLRMVPIKPLFQRLERLVRDLSREVGKPCHFQTEGEETEIDRGVVEELVDPLVHMVRNALDHGLEPPEARRAANKPETGALRLSARHEGGDLVVELADDGRGIDHARVLAKARSLGLVAPDATPSEDEVAHLIFLPGFSTAERVTAVSGRGVGMDVVKRNIERLRGRIQIETRAGRGTSFLVRLPLTAAIIDGLLVRVGEERFILPTLAVRMALRPTRALLTTIHGRGEALEHQGRILPLYRLHRVFGVEGARENPEDAIAVVVESGRSVYALLVDELLNKQEVVIKNVGAWFEGRPGVSGGAILGDGGIALILDPASLRAA